MKKIFTLLFLTLLSTSLNALWQQPQNQQTGQPAVYHQAGVMQTHANTGPERPALPFAMQPQAMQ